MKQTLPYFLSHHPTIVNFRWSHTHSWGSTWSFLFAAVFSFSSAALLLHLLLLRRRRPVPLGPLPALYSLLTAVTSAVILAGVVFSAVIEIKETRWIWRRSKTPLQWLLCFPIGTRSSGRVFFWTYVFYISRYVHLLRTFCAILGRRRLNLVQLLNRVVFVFTAYLWLEFSQSVQVMAVAGTAAAETVVYGYRFWAAAAAGVPAAAAAERLGFVLGFQVAALGYQVVCNCGVVVLHFVNGGCNGMGAWWLNCVLNGVVLVVFFGGLVGKKMRRKEKSL